MAPDARMQLAVVIPLYNEEATLPELHRRLTDVLQELPTTYEVLFVDDGSTDGTAAMLDEIAEVDPAVAVVHLSRNFGHQQAITAGLDLADGDAVVVMDGDLQDPPELIPQMLARWRQGWDVVYAVRRRRKERWFRRASYYVFYRLLRLVSDVPIPLDAGDFCLLDRAVVTAIRQLPERVRFVRGLRSFVGFRQTSLEYDRPPRYAGKAKYSLAALVRLALDGIVNFSSFPLNLVTCLGLLGALVACGLIVWVLLHALQFQAAPQGWVSTLMVVLFMGSVQLLSLGILGEYLRRIFLEVKGRPPYFIARYVKFRESTPREGAKRLDQQTEARRLRRD